VAGTSVHLPRKFRVGPDLGTSSYPKYLKKKKVQAFFHVCSCRKERALQRDAIHLAQEKREAKNNASKEFETTGFGMQA